jgi:hypothetical protein
MVGLTTVGVLLLVSLWIASAGLVAAPANSTASGLRPAIIPGDYITYHCTNVEITVGGAVVCNNQASSKVDSCDSTYCVVTLAAEKFYNGAGFVGWTSTGDAYLDCNFYGCNEGCGTAQENLLNPDPYFCMSVPNSGDICAGEVTVLT